jgi:hypothetical protein
MQEQARNSQQIAAEEMPVLIREHQITPKPVRSHCKDPVMALVKPR